jgi:hypothetical protein
MYDNKLNKLDEMDKLKERRKLLPLTQEEIEKLVTCGSYL